MGALKHGTFLLLTHMNPKISFAGIVLGIIDKERVERYVNRFTKVWENSTGLYSVDFGLISYLSLPTTFATTQVLYVANYANTYDKPLNIQWIRNIDICPLFSAAWSILKNPNIIFTSLRHKIYQIYENFEWPTVPTIPDDLPERVSNIGVATLRHGTFWAMLYTNPKMSAVGFALGIVEREEMKSYLTRIKNVWENSMAPYAIGVAAVTVYAMPTSSVSPQIVSVARYALYAVSFFYCGMIGIEFADEADKNARAAGVAD